MHDKIDDSYKLDQSKISTIRSISDFDITSKINQWNVSPNTRKIMMIQNKKIKHLQEKILKLQNEKSSNQNWLNKEEYVHKNELMQILSNLIPTITSLHKQDSTTASERWSQLSFPHKNRQDAIPYIEYNDDQRFQKRSMNNASVNQKDRYNEGIAIKNKIYLTNSLIVVNKSSRLYDRF